MKNLKILKLMMADIIEEDNYTEGTIGDDLKVYPMEDLHHFEEHIKRFKLNIEDSPNFNLKDDYFKLNKAVLVNLCEQEYEEYLIKYADEIVNGYSLMEKEGNNFWNNQEVKEAILVDHITETTELDIDKTIIYQDIELSEIASILQEVHVDELIANLGYYGMWEIVKKDNMNYLVN